MFKSIRLSFKISLGFAVILILAIALGSVALWNMKQVEQLSVKLDHEYMPEVGVAGNVERYSLQTMFELRGYNLFQDKQYLEKARGNLKEVRKFLDEAKQLSAKSPDLVKLKEGVALAEARLNEFDQLINQTIAKEEELANIRKVMDEAAGKYIKNANEYDDNQQKLLKEEVKNSESPEKLLDRMSKLVLINDVTDAGNAIRIANFKFQAMADPKFIDEAMKIFSEIDAKLEILLAGTVLEQGKKDLGEVAAGAVAYKKAIQDFSTTWQALREINKKRGETGEQVVLAAKNTALSGLEQADQAAGTSTIALSSASRILTVGLAIVLLLGIGIAFTIVRAITKPIRRVVEGLAEGADQVASASAQVAGSSQQLAEGASEQAASIEETSSSLEEMSSMTKQNAENAGHADKLMAETSHVLTKANQSMNKLTSSMLEITRASEETSKIIKTIDEIAFQTNLLALNAAVEAARAGEAGAGFAVVANEVRNLAMRAAEAAKNTANLIEGTVKKIKDGSELVEETSADFSQVAASAGKMSELIGDISAASTEQAQGIDQVNSAVGQMDKVVQQNAASAEESASAAEEMNSQATNMQTFVCELIAIVEGSGNAGSKAEANVCTLHVAPAVQSRKASFRELPAPGGGSKKPHRGNGTSKTFQQKPEDIIPFDDGEGMTDF
jgi:methyl-accepting chemotaxis protein